MPGAAPGPGTLGPARLLPTGGHWQAASLTTSSTALRLCRTESLESDWAAARRGPLEAGPGGADSDSDGEMRPRYWYY